MNLSSVLERKSKKECDEDNQRSISFLLLPIVIVAGGSGGGGSSAVECSVLHHDNVVVKYLFRFVRCFHFRRDR